MGYNASMPGSHAREIDVCSTNNCTWKKWWVQEIVGAEINKYSKKVLKWSVLLPVLFSWQVLHLSYFMHVEANMTEISISANQETNLHLIIQKLVLQKYKCCIYNMNAC